MRRITCVFLVLLCVLLAGCQSNQTVSSISYQNVDQINAEALKAFDSGDYSNALMKYSDAMKNNPIDMDAMIGTIKCQIALENYSMASTNLSAAVKVDPQNTEIYDLYIALSEASDSIGYARTAVTLARQNNVESFLSKVPDSPTLNYEDGKYDSRFEVEVAADSGAEIFVIEETDSYRDSYQYFEPIPIARGNTSLEVYCIKNGIPSETVEVQYICDYPPVEVSFADPIIERLVRLEIGNEFGPITDVDCESIDELRQYDLRNAGMDWEEYENVRVKSLEDLHLFINLRYLYLENVDSISDYSPLSACKRLTSLQIDESGLTDISFVKYLPNLGYLSIRDNQISDLTPLSNCKSLYNLDIIGNPVKELGSLAEMDIEYLYVTASSIEDLSVLSNFEKMTDLHIYGCGGLDLSPLGAMTGLETLGLYAEDWTSNNYWDERVPLSNFGFISELESLETLNLNGISDYSELDCVKSLKNLTQFDVMTLDYEPIPNNLLQELQTALPNCTIENHSVYYG